MQFEGAIIKWEYSSDNQLHYYCNDDKTTPRTTRTHTVQSTCSTNHCMLLVQLNAESPLIGTRKTVKFVIQNSVCVGPVHWHILLVQSAIIIN